MGPSDWVALAAAAVGAFLGAVLAFALEALRQWRRERRDRHAALMQAQFVLSMQLNTLVSINQQYLDEARSDPERFMKLPLFHTQPDDARVDFAALAFVAADDQIEVLQTVHVAQDSFFTVAHTIDVRNRMLEEIYATETGVTDFDFESGAGTVSIDVRKARVLKGATDGLYQAVDAGIELGQAAIRQLGEASKRLYPKKPIVTVEFASAAPRV